MRIAAFLLLAGLAMAAPFISGCPISFEFMNYTIITSKCKGPRYLADPCCSSFKEFACPYTEQINNLTYDCASTMFSYINLYGHYPPGLFSSECREGKQGLDCSAYLNTTANSPTNSAYTHHGIFPLAGFLSGFLAAVLIH
ncbi:GPI-anchored protein LORELEI [Apostasia shenzhenica]|uniref:GPI-anchored protein LORELEI n=1 Tax=Apostasia shenzhenica TaxID=1088818 RepID=A0A2I0A6R5_9ASPA|nr:GPI-anchored protein LORELEI [Apostasia shenzhenica]